MDYKGKAKRRYGATRMSVEALYGQNEVVETVPEIAMRLRPALITTILSLSALSGTAAGAQVLGEQSTLLTAYVTEQATLSLPSQANTIMFPSGAKGVAGSV